MTISDGSDTDDTGANQQEGAVQNGDDAGGGLQPSDLDKVTNVIRETVGIDLDEVIAQREKAAAATAAADAGRKAQETYDPRISKLQKELQGMNAELYQAKQDARLAEIAKMPPEKQEVARELLKAETTVKEMVQMRQTLNDAAKTVATEQTALKLQKLGITCEAKDFEDCDTFADMEARAERLRGDDLERQLKEAKESKATGADKGGEQPPTKQSPGASQKPAPKKGDTGGTSGAKPWEEHKGKGLNKGLAAALRAQREAQ